MNKEELLSKTEAMRRLTALSSKGSVVAGVDVFKYRDGILEPIMDLIADLSGLNSAESISEAQNFIINCVADDLLIELTIL